MNQPGSLDFLQQKTSVYYTALDAEAFPEWDRRSKREIDSIDQIAYLKALSLLVDHIIVPPSYLIRLLNSKSSIDFLRGTIGEYIESGAIMTTVYMGMGSPIDFVEMKANKGDSKEKSEFGNKLLSAKELYGSMPLYHRDVSKQVNDFKYRVLSRIENLTSLSDSTKNRVLSSFETEENYSRINFGRALIVNAMNKIKLSRSDYRTIFYIMNSEYYRGGAISSNSDISCVNVHEYSILGKDIFQQKSNGIVVGYDPSLFLYVMGCHSISKSEVASLTFKDIEALRRSSMFSDFVKQYNELVLSIQKLDLVGSSFGREYLQQLRNTIAREILGRYRNEERFYNRLLTKEDFGVSVVLGGLGFALGGPVGASILAALGLAHPAFRKFSTSPVEVITRKLRMGKVSFYLYLKQLEEVISNAENEP